MFGLLRLVLAVMVVIGHLFWISDLGRYAVFTFFILSGYLMTMVMHESYGYTPAGVARFTGNRFLRLYPAYWISCLLSIALIVYFGEDATRHLFGQLALPREPAAVFGNVTLLFPSLFPEEISPKLAPASWALTVEILYYALIALGLSATRRRTLWWLALSVLYVLITMALGYSWRMRYSIILAGSLPFAVGALLYFLNKENWHPRWMQARWFGSRQLCVVMLLAAVAGSLLQVDEKHMVLMELVFYCNLAVSALLVYSLLRGGQLISISRKTDKVLGDFSYPVYLTHWQAGMIASYGVLGNVSRMKYLVSPWLWCTTALLLVLFGLALIRLVDRPVELLRDRLRGKPAY